MSEVNLHSATTTTSTTMKAVESQSGPWDYPAKFLNNFFSHLHQNVYLSSKISKWPVIYFTFTPTSLPQNWASGQHTPWPPSHRPWQPPSPLLSRVWEPTSGLTQPCLHNWGASLIDPSDVSVKSLLSSSVEWKRADWWRRWHLERRKGNMRKTVQRRAGGYKGMMQRRDRQMERKGTWKKVVERALDTNRWWTHGTTDGWMSGVL